MPAKKFQLAVQGGGAHVVDYLAALEVVQRYEAEEKIEITRLAGTSAGAFATTVYASGPGSVQRARSCLQVKGLGFFEDIIRRRFLRWNPDIAVRLLEGGPLFSVDAFGDAIREVLAEARAAPGREPPATFNDLWKRALFIVTTDFRNRRAHVYNDGNLLDAVLNSAAFPVVFRGVRDLEGNATVDGGLCENLPVDCLRQGENEFGPIIAISLPRRLASIRVHNLLNYGRELFETAMVKSVERARAFLHEDAVLEVKSTLGIFDFEAALTESEERTRETAQIQSDAADWLQKNIRRVA